MAEVVTIAERKTREATRRRLASIAIMDELRTFAIGQQGRFVVFGSVAENRMSFDSDLDVLIDFPQAGESAAVAFVEEVCRARNLPVDILLGSQASEGFLARISGHAVTLS